jgi:uncharacterized membrane protein YfcA
LENAINFVVACLTIGFFIDMTGMVGSAVMSPLLILVFKVNPVLTVGTGLVFASITKIGGGLQHWQ